MEERGGGVRVRGGDLRKGRMQAKIDRSEDLGRAER